MSPSSLIKLIGSLSGPEKRFFKLQSKMQNGSKEYLLLFDLIERSKIPDVNQLSEEFKKLSPGGSWNNTRIYLGNMLLDCLVRAKTEKDVFFDLLQEIQQIRILKERSLDQEAFKKAKKVQRKAASFQLHWIEYYCYRYELNYYSDNNFSEINDEELVRLQMKGKEVLRGLNHIHDHYSLYELLKYRLIHVGKVVSDEGKKKLNDLMLSEMVLVAGKSKSFSSQKLHLLFQSFFFTDIGDYKAALKSFYQLNDLLEKNEAFLDNPPLDYFSALNGIIDSLYVMGNNTEVPYYLEKIKNLDQPSYPEYFRYLVRKTVYSQQLVRLLHDNDPEAAIHLVNTIPSDVFDSYAMVDEEKQSELYFYCSLVYFQQKNWRKAHWFLSEIMNRVKLPDQLLISKAIRLLNIIIYYEKGELPHLEYEIRSYKRYFVTAKLQKTEKLIFRIITSSAPNKRLQLMANEKKKILSELDGITNDKYERQLLKYFDFTGWITQIIQRSVVINPGKKHSEKIQ
jgi:hypothetical protein